MSSTIERSILRGIHNTSKSGIGLMTGNSGLLMFFGSAKDATLSANSEILLNKIVSSNIMTDNYSLSRGLSGVLYALQSKSTVDLIDNESKNNLDQELFDYFLSDVNIHDFDYLHGYLGIIRYLISGTEFNLDIPKVHQIFYYLFGFLEQNDAYPKDKKIDQNKFYANFGLAHGIPSFLSVLASFDKKFPSQINRDRLQKLSNFIVDCRHKYGKNVSIYPSSLYKNPAEAMASRLAWCYGDLGVGITLLKTCTYLNDRETEFLVVSDLVKSAKRRELSSFIVDASFCHGSSGAHYIFKLLYERYREKEFLSAAEFWKQNTIRRFQENGPSGLYYYRQYDKSHQAETGLLEGLAGVYFSLYSDQFDTKLFNEIFLLDF